MELPIQPPPSAAIGSYMISMIDDAVTGWLLSCSETTTHSKMRLTKPVPRQEAPLSPSALNHSDFEYRTAACVQTSKKLQRRYSFSSDHSTPELSDDAFGTMSPNSVVSFEDSYNPSSPDLRSDELWESWFEGDFPIQKSLLYHTHEPTFCQTSIQITTRCESPIVPGLNYPGDLHRPASRRVPYARDPHHSTVPYTADLHVSGSPLHRSAAHRNRSRTIQTSRPVPQSGPSYSAFPAALPTVLPSPTPKPSHHSWPQRTDSNLPNRPTRPRAQTTPSQERVTTMSKSTSHLPSPPHQLLPTDYHSAPTMLFGTTSSINLPHHEQEIMLSEMLSREHHQDGIVEQFISHFDYDEDEDEDEPKSSFSSFFGRGGSSSGSSGGSWGKRSSGKGSGDVRGAKVRGKKERKSLGELRELLRGWVKR